MMMVLSSEHILVPVLYLKGKDFFIQKNGVFVYVGNAFKYVKKNAKNYKLLHIIDEDLNTGKGSNLDFYDDATYYTHIEVEVQTFNSRILHIIDKLISFNVRIVSKDMRLITYILNKNKALAVLEVDVYTGDEPTRDVLALSLPSNFKVSSKCTHRIFVHRRTYDTLPNTSKPYIFGVLL